MSSSRLIFTLLIVSIGAVVCASAMAVDDVYNPLKAIGDEYEAGKITLDEKALLVVAAIKNPEQLPTKYRGAMLASGVRGFRGATMALKEVMVDYWGELSPETQQSVSEAMTRHATAYDYASPGGFFRLHYDTIGIDRVPATDADISGVPDYVERVASYCDTSIEVHRSLGYLDPPSDGGLGGDELYDVYFEDMIYYGYTVPEGAGPMPWNDKYSHLVMHNDFLGFPANQDPEGNQAGAAKVTAAHELHHAVQFAYDAGEDIWFMEADAVYMEDIAYDHTNDNYNYLSDFFNFPQTSLMKNNSHAYACFIWPLYLAQRFDTSLLVSAWEGATQQTVFDALGDTLQVNYGWSQDSAFAEFTTWNFITGLRNDGLHHEEAASYPAVDIAQTHLTYPVEWRDAPHYPEGYGACYIEFKPHLSEGELTVFFDGADPFEWAVYAIISTSIDEHTVQSVTIDPVTGEGKFVVDYFQDYYSVTLVGINVTEFASAAVFQYSATVRDPYAVSSAVMTDSLVYSGSTREFAYRIYNTSTLNDVFDVSCTDNAGWVLADTVDVAVAAGDSTTVGFDVEAPTGTPLSSLDTLLFETVSKSDSLVTDSHKVVATTVLQRGDVNFSGDIDISDLTWLVNYLFIEGPEPIPILESGNLNCAGEVDISDLTHIVNYLFLQGPGVSCNPF